MSLKADPLVTDVAIFLERRGEIRPTPRGVDERTGVEFTEGSGDGEWAIAAEALHHGLLMRFYPAILSGVPERSVEVETRNAGGGRSYGDLEYPIVDDIPGTALHSGMRCRFGQDGKLYVTTGDSTDWNLAQKTDSLAGNQATNTAVKANVRQNKSLKNFGNYSASRGD